MANILFEYLYRDASNWKQYGQAVFTNIGKIPLADIEAQIRATMHDGQWFKAEMMDLETCFFSGHDTDDDHPWHEFWEVSKTDLPTTDPRDIALFIQEMQKGSLRKWDESNLLCHICGQPFTEGEWENRHDLHEPDCPRTKTAGKKSFMGEIHCHCNLVAHVACCPECNKPKIEAKAESVPA
jgi:hypothetical protein